MQAKQTGGNLEPWRIAMANGADSEDRGAAETDARPAARRPVLRERFLLESEGLRLRVFAARPEGPTGPLASVQIHHGGGGCDPVYEALAEDLARRGFAGVVLVHRGYPGSEGRMEYGKGEIVDVGNLAEELRSRPWIDPLRMGIMGYSRGAHNALLAVARYPFFRAAALWSPPVDMVDHVAVNPWIAEIVGGSAEEVPEEYARRSGLLYAETITCPVLILHGADDEVIPVRHARRLAAELERLGRPFELRVLPGEGHVWSPAAFGGNWHRTVTWFRRFLR